MARQRAMSSFENCPRHLYNTLLNISREQPMASAQKEATKAIIYIFIPY